MPTLTTSQVRLQMKTVPEWSKRGRVIHRTFKFDGFLESIAFVNRIAKQAQKVDHHPDIAISFDKVKLKLTSHDEGGLTKKDFALARQCNAVFLKPVGARPTAPGPVGRTAGPRPRGR